MADINLTIDTGVKSLELTDGKGHSVVVTFNPYDVLFFGTIMDAADKLDAEQTKLREIQSDDLKVIYQACMDADKAMREIIDGIFNAPVCDALFPNQTVHAIGNGFPAWCNLLSAIADHIDAGLEAEKEKAQARIKKYSSKYKR